MLLWPQPSSREHPRSAASAPFGTNSPIPGFQIVPVPEEGHLGDALTACPSHIPTSPRGAAKRWGPAPRRTRLRKLPRRILDLELCQVFAATTLQAKPTS